MVKRGKVVFLNVDFDITCSKGLDTLIEELSKSMFILIRVNHFASL